MERAVQSGDWREVREFYLTTFDSFIEINAAFKVGDTNRHTVDGLSLSRIPVVRKLL